LEYVEIIGVVAAVMTIIGFVIKYSKRVRKVLRRKYKLCVGKLRGYLNLPPKDELAHKLLLYFWGYPTSGKSETSPEKSWAVKESDVLKDNLKDAREKPGLGAAVFSFELALKVIGLQKSKMRFTKAIAWAQGRTREVDCSDLVGGEDFSRMRHG